MEVGETKDSAGCFVLVGTATSALRANKGESRLTVQRIKECVGGGGGGGGG